MTNRDMRPLLPLRFDFRLMLMPFAALLLCLLAIPALAQVSPASSDLPTPPGASVIKLTPKPGDFTEPSIAINPNDPRQLVGAFQVNASVGYSRDAGQTWSLAENTAPPDYKISGDVSVAYDNQGRAFLCYIAFDKLGTENYWAHGATRNGIFVRRSLDGGQTWEKDARVGHAVFPLHRRRKLLVEAHRDQHARGSPPRRQWRRRRLYRCGCRRRNSLRRLVRPFRHRVRSLPGRRP